MNPIRYFISCINSQIDILNTHYSQCTHITVPYKNTNNIDFIQKLFQLKLKNRYIKTLIDINISEIEQLGTKKFLKLITNCGFDGIIFNQLHNSNPQTINKIISVLSILSPPYNFPWEFYLYHPLSTLMPPNSSITQIIIPKSAVKTFTDIGWKPEQLLITSNTDDNNILEYVKYHKLGGIYNINEEISLFYINGLKHSLNYKNQNHIEYPTSKILFNNYNDIIDSYTNHCCLENLEIELHINFI